MLQPYEFELCGYIWNSNAILSFGTIIVAIFTFLAAIGAFLSARATKNAAQAQILFNFLDEYSSKKMGKYLADLAEYKKIKAEDSKTRLDLQNAEKAAEDARRPIKHFFFKAQRIKNAGFIDDRFMKQICGLAGFELLFEIIEPMEKDLGLINPEGENIYKELRKYTTKS